VKNRRVLAAVAVAATFALTLTGCSSSGGKSGSKITGSIKVLAASSLMGTFTTIKTQFEKKYPGTNITFDFEASTALATEITQGDRADVFASASPTTMATVTSAKDASDPKTFASNTMEIAVPPSNPAGVTSVNDLAKSTVKVAVCAAAVPCGVVAQEVFTNAKVTVHPVAQEPDVASCLAVVESGEVDAGVVYVTDVQGAGSKVKGITIPASINATTLYPIATLKDAPNSATAAAFKAYVLSPAGQKVLADAGFAKA
jgi:molybdate transport system substrate-binding protein